MNIFVCSKTEFGPFPKYEAYIGFRYFNWVEYVDAEENPEYLPAERVQGGPSDFDEIPMGREKQSGAPAARHPWVLALGLAALGFLGLHL